MNDSQDGPMEGADIRSCVTDGEERLRVWWKDLRVTVTKR